MTYEDLVARIGEEKLHYIASLDYGQDSEKHYEAIREVLYKQQGIVNSEQSWYPYEVVELGANHLMQNHETEFALCTCLVAKAIIAGVDTSTTADEKLENHAQEYDRLPNPLRELVLEHLERASS